MKRPGVADGRWRGRKLSGVLLPRYAQDKSLERDPFLAPQCPAIGAHIIVRRVLSSE